MDTKIAEFPYFQSQSQIPVVSNANAFQFPKLDQLKKRVLYKCLDIQGNPCDPIQVQTPGVVGFCCPQQYKLVRVHFANGIPAGAWIQSIISVSSPIIYIKSTRIAGSIQENMITLTTATDQPGVYNFGGLYQTVVIDNPQNLDYTAITYNNNMHISQQVQTKTQYMLPSFSVQPHADQSVLVGIYLVLNQLVFVYGYIYDIYAIARPIGVDNHNIISETVRILKDSSDEIQTQYNLAFSDLLFQCFGQPLATLVLDVGTQGIAIQNASLYINGKKQFSSLVIQGNDDVKDRMGLICSDSRFNKTSLCACYNSDIMPCLSTTCQTLGYKDSALFNQDCNTAIKGMTINYQNCESYINLAAGGTISGDINVEQRCQQIVKQDDVVIQKTENDQVPKDTKSPNIEIYNILLNPVLLGFVALLVLIVIALIILRRKRQSSQPQSDQQLPYQSAMMYNVAQYQ